MVLSLIAAILIGFLTIIIPGFLLALALLRKTHLHIVEISMIGFIFGFIGPPILTWLESYLMNSIHFFSFSLTLYLVNVVILSILGIILCMWQGAFKNFMPDYFPKRGAEHTDHHKQIKKSHNLVWILLLIIVLSTFLTRMQSIPTAPSFFEFDPYFDMIDAQSIVTLGYQFLNDPSAWPIVAGGTNHRVEPLVPYIDAFWYDLSNSIGPHFSSFNTTMMSNVASYYPPIAAALLVFVIFMLLYHEYNEYIALIGAGLTALMPVLFTTFIAGEQLVESWGIFALFFFLAAYMLAVRNPKSKRFALLAGFAFASNFLGAHYYTVTVGVFAMYIILQGIIDVIKGTGNKDFYKMNILVIATMAIIFGLFYPYSSTLQNRVPDIAGIPIIVSGPLLALAFVALMDYLPKLLKKWNVLKQDLNRTMRLAWVVLLIVIGFVAVVATPLGKPIQGYISLSIHFTTPSVPLFMTVEEYIPTGIGYNFGAGGFGMLGYSIFSAPATVYLVLGLSTILLLLSVIYRNNKMAIFYLAAAWPLAIAGFSEVKYLPHFGIAYILLFCVMLGEAIYAVEKNFDFRGAAKSVQGTINPVVDDSPKKNNYIVYMFFALGIFAISTFLALIYLVYVITKKTFAHQYAKTYLWGLFALFLIIIIASSIASHAVLWGESASYLSSLSSAVTVATTPNLAAACQQLAAANDSLGENLYCNTIPSYWLNAMAWVKSNVGPTAPRVLAWWDYGDWINWFGGSNAVLRGDNAEPLEDYATAAQFVLSASDGYTPQTLANFMNTNQTKYVLFDQDLIQKWGALDFLGCVGAGQTTQAFAVAQGAAQNPPVPYVLGNSRCEQSHDPQIALVPLSALIGNQSTQNINMYCSASNATVTLISSPLIVGNNFTNQSVCVDPVPNGSGVLSVFDTHGKKINAVIQSSYYEGVGNIQGTTFVEYLMIYLPNGPNDTITDAPSGFYTSNYYKGFFLGNLPGFHQVYPVNAPGVNLVNVSAPVRIFALDNYTGGSVVPPQKPSWVQNNYTMP